MEITGRVVANANVKKTNNVKEVVNFNIAIARAKRRVI